MTYDEVMLFEKNGTCPDFGYIRGNDRIVFVKVGLGGDHIGRENKYLRMAHRLRERYGCSVICVANPNSEKFGADADSAIITDFVRRHGIKSPELYFFGNSNGCIKGLSLAASGMPFRKMILVNMPLMINFHKTKTWLSRIPQTEIVAIYGERDPSYAYIPFLEGRAERLEIVRVPDADHNFTEKTDAFIAFADRLMEG